MNPNRPARLNRTILATLGVITLAAGAFVLLLGTRLLRSLVPIPPDTPLLTTDSAPPSWAPWAAAATAIIIALLALRWLIAQTIRRPPSSSWQLAPDTSTGATHIDSDTAAEPLGQEITDYPDVHTATARLTGPRQHPHLHLTVTTNHSADITTLRHRIDTEAIPHLTHALNLPTPTADLLLRLNTSNHTRTQ